MTTLAACALAIVLLTDVSRSVDETRFELQRSGIAAAFRDPTIHELIEDAPGGVAFTHVQFAGTQEQSIGWTVLRTRGEAMQFANEIEATPRPSESKVMGSTAIFSAVRFGITLMESQPCEEPRKKVIDVAADGEDNASGVDDFEETRKLVLESGVQVNALAILGATIGQTARLEPHLQEEVISPDGFMMTATSHADVNRVFRRKLAREMAMNMGGTLTQ